jgi:hypothetical protein
MFEPNLSSSFAIPHGLPDWARVSSLPSDHAAMFVALACGLIFVSRKWGLLLLLHAVFFVLLPRAFVGLHYFWDLAVGALIGVLFALLCNSGFVRSRVSAPLVRIEESHAPVFYGAMFMLTLQIADLFHGTRQVLESLRRALAALADSLGIAPSYQPLSIGLLTLLVVAGYILVRKRRHRMADRERQPVASSDGPISTRGTLLLQ